MLPKQLEHIATLEEGKGGQVKEVMGCILKKVVTSVAFASAWRSSSVAIKTGSAAERFNFRWMAVELMTLTILAIADA